MALDELYFGGGDVEAFNLSASEDMPTFDNKIWDKAIEHIHNKGGFTSNMMTDEPIADVVKELTRVLSTSVGAGSIEYSIPVEMDTRLRNDVTMFSGFKTVQELQQAGQLLYSNNKLKSFDSFKQDVLKVNSQYNVNYLNAEYEFAVASAQMAGKWAEFVADGDRYYLQYRTAHDGKVREEHAALDGITLPVSDPFWSSYFPPNGWRCRCTVVQVLKGKYQTSDSEQAMAVGDAATATPKKAIFRFNPGQKGVAFPEKHPYYKVGDNARKNVMKAVHSVAKSEYIDIPTTKGQVRCSIRHGKNELRENIAIAKQLAEAFNEEINLLPIEHVQGKKNPDSFNVTRRISQEYKTTKNTKTAIDKAIRRAKDQADYIVIDIKEEMETDVLMEIIRGRVHRSENIKEVIIINNGKIIKLNRDEIIHTTEQAAV